MEPVYLKVEEEDRAVDLTLKSGEEESAKKQITLADLKADSFVKAHVTKVEKYGVFLRIVDSDRCSGLCHISQASDDFVSDLNTLYKVRRQTFKALA